MVRNLPLTFENLFHITADAGPSLMGVEDLLLSSVPEFRQQTEDLQI